MARRMNAKVLSVARSVSRQLTDRGIAHAVVGGLAVAAAGYNRTTDDVDVLVTDSSSAEIGGDLLGGEVLGKTVRVRGVDVDVLFADEDYLEEAIAAVVARGGQKVPYIGVVPLVVMKVAAGRMKDQADVVELLKRGKVPVARVAALLRRARPELVDDFEALVAQAREEAR